MFSIWKKIPLLFVYIASFLLIVTALIFVSWGIMAGRIIETLEKEAVGSTRKALRSFSSVLEMRMDELDHTAVKLLHNPRVSKYMVCSGGYDASLIQGELDKYRSSNSIIEDIAVVYHDSDFIAASEGFYQNKDYFRYIRRYEHWPIDAVYSDLSNRPAPYLRPSETVWQGAAPDRIMTYVYPFSHSLDARGGILFQISQKNLMEMITQALGSYEGYVLLLDEQKNLLITRQVGTSAPNQNEVLSMLFANEENDFFYATFDEENYAVMTMRSEINGYHYAALLPLSQFCSSMDEARRFNLFILLGLLACGILGVFLITLVSYRPIETIVRTVRPKSSSNSKKRNELSMILETIEDIQKQNIGLSHRLYSGAGYIRDYALLLLLHGHSKAVSPDVLGNLLDLGNIRARGGRYAVILMKNESIGIMNEDTPEMQYLIRYGMINVTEELVNQNSVGYGLDLPGQSTVALLLRGEGTEEAWKEELMERMEKLTAQLTKIFQTRCFVGIGNPFPLFDIVQSFEQAQKALIQGVVKGNYEIQIWNEHQTSPSACHMPLEQEMELITAVKQGNPETCRSGLREIIRQLSASSLPPQTVQFMWSGLMNRIWRTLSELNIDLSAGYLKQLQYLSTEHPQPMETLERETLSLLEEICQIVERKKCSHNHTLHKQLLNFMDENFSDSGLTFDGIADAFHLSPSYLSRFFKQQQGETVSKYLDRIRMEHAKRLLRMTQQKLREIVAACGYLDEANFIRKFRKMEGVTPVQYREVAYTAEIGFLEKENANLLEDEE